MSKEIKDAVDTLKKAFKEDSNFAYAWHCNLAMCFYDSMDEGKREDKHKISNNAASNFMKLCFDVETKYLEDG